MGRKIAVPWHLLFSLVAGALYFFFVLPRWPELMGDTAHTLGTVLRIVTGALVALAALPVVFTLLRTRKPELGTPQLALSIRIWSIVAHVLAGVLIIGAAISEIWLTLDAAGRWLFGIYGAAAAIALLGIFAFYLSFVAELPPPPPKPIKAKKPKKRRVRRKKGGEAEEDEAEETETAAAEAEETEEAEQAEPAAEPAEVTAETTAAEAAPEPTTEAAAVADTAELAGQGNEPKAKLRNRRPTGKGSHRMRRRSTGAGVALDESGDED
ncbi:hypothetical protein MMAN_46060 [Mycobacterium mantenii]|uniref:Transmembrane protein n=1 Tax=Mycobacterium mantenii TaxID=560555 RepID=A0A1X0FTY7_MYCNT|nr:hypothetical protein [Mycobacterium mantenii]MCV7243969.1 hypothetical protein [Mycobacterium mantenii]ORB05231.1 hypothetical protein BST30_14695 [Mycobacterium mantenii]BBY40472.1 hypothetical protein MMAN_46060 [Mycobacterium mantenii]